MATPMMSSFFLLLGYDALGGFDLYGRLYGRVLCATTATFGETTATLLLAQDGCNMVTKSKSDFIRRAVNRDKCLLVEFFSTTKSLIPLIHPFQFDSLFHDLDVLLFAGVEPWRVFHRVFDSPLITMVVNFAYNVWLLLVWATLSYFLIARSTKARMQFFYSVGFLCWALLGVVLATLLSSAGPAFFCIA
ncbi:hypothetical protein QW180_16235 [Vibrio sinaloensis]|nr:hypothetical protein [Vibrio sinaloensis]